MSPTEPNDKKVAELLPLSKISPHLVATLIDWERRERKETPAGTRVPNTGDIPVVAVLIELKRPERKMELGDLLKQGEKYRDGLTALLVNRRRENEPIEVVFLIGVPLKNWNNPKRRDEDEDVFRRKGMRVLLYKELLDNTRHIYSEYLVQRKETGRIQRLLNSIDDAVLT